MVDLVHFFLMWDQVLLSYIRQPAMYFEIFNEPFGYSTAEWSALCAEWLMRYPSLPRERILVGGTGYDDNITAMGADTRFQDCLLSLHIYAFWENLNSVAAWKEDLAKAVSLYANRTILTEFGVTMNTGVNYTTSNPGTDNDVCFLQAVVQDLRAWGMSSCYWPGLRIGDGYSLQILTGDYSMTTTNPSGVSELLYGWGVQS